MRHPILLSSLRLAALLLLSTGVALHAQGRFAPEPDSYWPARTAASTFGAAGDEQWNAGIGPFGINGPVYETVIAPNGDLYIGGDFSTVGGISANRIAKWDGSTWSALGTGIPAGAVYAIAFHGNDVIVGGRFAGAGDVKATNIARWNGSKWLAYGDITREGLDSTVLAIVPTGNDFYVAGNFTYNGTQDILNKIARWSAADTLFIPLDDGIHRGTDGGVTTMALVGNDLYVGGTFTKGGDSYASRIVKWNGTAWTNLSSGVSLTGSEPIVLSIAVRDTSIIVGGKFSLAGGKPIKNVAQWSTTSQSWFSVGKGGFDSMVYRVAANDKGYVFATGPFTLANGVPIPHIGRWILAEGWTPLGSGLDVPGFALATSGDQVWVGGMFTTAGGKGSASLARWTEVPPLGVDRATATAEAMAADVVPNPVSASGMLRVNLREPGAPRITISDSRGDEVMSLAPGMLPAGEQRVPLDARLLPNGVYRARVVCAGQVTTASFVVAR